MVASPQLTPVAFVTRWHARDNSVPLQVLSSASEILDKPGQALPLGRVHVCMVLILDKLVVHAIRLDSLCVETPRQETEKALLKLLGQSLKVVLRILCKKFHLS